MKRNLYGSSIAVAVRFSTALTVRSVDFPRSLVVHSVDRTL